jgi:hypothetical protein
MVFKASLPMLLIFLCIGMAGSLHSQDEISFTGDIEEKISYFHNYTLPQKVYLHLNKSSYNAGDAIWIKAYLVDGVTHTPDTAATNLYIDLVSSRGLIMAKRILLTDKGFAEGDIELPRDMPDGNYKIRAYTDWMRNFGEEYYFTEHFYIYNKSYEDIIPRAEAGANRRFNNNLEDMKEQVNVVFFPEGGNMITGVPGRVAFKVFDGTGRGLEAEGEIINHNSEVVTTFSTLDGGVGSFDLTPAEGVSYTASVRVGDERPQDYELPMAVKQGTGIRVDQDDEYISADIVSARPVTGGQNTDAVKVIAHTRGNVIYGESLILDDGKASISIPKSDFPSGIAQITVFMADNTPVAERLVFVFHESDAFVFYPEISRQTVGDREYYVVGLDVRDKQENPVKGHFSMSVLHTEKGMPAVKGNIISHLLLSSDLPGITQEIHELFDPDENSSDVIDHLMMTYGWRRFNWDDVLTRTMPEINHLPSSALTVSGTVTDPSNDQLLPNFPVNLNIRGMENGRFSTSTNNNGVFLFEDLIFYNDTRIRISSDRLVSNSPPRLELNTGEFRNIDFVVNSLTVPNLVTRRGSNWERTPGAGTSPYGMVREERAAPRQYGVPDQTVYLDEEVRQPNMYDILVTRVRGLNHNMQFRGPSSITLSSTPLFMLDGTEVGQSAFLNLNPRYIERIEIFSGPKASIFGVRGSSGAILAYTRRASDPGLAAWEDYLIQGYHSPREYYADLMSSFRGNNSEYAQERALHWEPNLITDESGVVSTAVPVVKGGGTVTFVIHGLGIEGGMGYGFFSISPVR